MTTSVSAARDHGIEAGQVDAFRVGAELHVALARRSTNARQDTVGIREIGIGIIGALPGQRSHTSKLPPEPTFNPPHEGIDRP